MFSTTTIDEGGGGLQLGNEAAPGLALGHRGEVLSPEELEFGCSAFATVSWTPSPNDANPALGMQLLAGAQVHGQHGGSPVAARPTDGGTGSCQHRGGGAVSEHTFCFLA